MTDRRLSKYTSVDEDVATVQMVPETAQTQAPAFRLAFEDLEFLRREDMRSVRFQLELLKPELMMSEAGIESTVVLFGGSRIPDPADKASARTGTLAALSKYYDEARRFAYLISEESLSGGGRNGFPHGAHDFRVVKQFTVCQIYTRDSR